MFDPYYNTIPYVNREIRRKVERYQKKHPNLTFTQAYNKVFGTNYEEPKDYLFLDTTTCQQKRKDDTSSGDYFNIR